MVTATDDFIQDLPIYDFRDKIVDAVDQNQVTIITAETGAGKSTQVPQYLQEHGYEKVIVTQPRILAARNLSRRVREESAQRLGHDTDDMVGYRTAHERDDNPDTAILYCTDGLQLVREITGAGITQRQVLVLDEVHEWNENMEVLIAWAKRRCQEEPRFKVVIMSATIETNELAQYFGTSAVINVPGRTYEVTKHRGTDLISEIIDKLPTGHNMLVFLPGKAEIENVATQIGPAAQKAGVPIIPLHSQLEATAQQQAFASYPNGKVILSTNIAQTSVTIDDIDVVIDSGLERRSEVRNGVEGLFLAQISQADCLQRAGRAGRTKAGEYILAPYEEMECQPFELRPKYPVPEILRKHIDRLTLRLASVGIDIEMLDFYHDPSTSAKKRAKRTLVALGALSTQGDITRIGRQMEQFPVESQYARMLVEASDLPPETQAKLAAIIAIQEVGGIVKGGTRYTGWRKYTRQTKSDLLAAYEVFLALPAIPDEEQEDIGIITKNVSKAEEVMRRLTHDLGLAEHEFTPLDRDEEDPLRRCIVAGQIDQLWAVEEYGRVVHIMTKQRRELSSSTVVKNPTLIAGTPFDLQIPTASGSLETLHLVQAVTSVDTKWLEELSPHLFEKRRGKIIYDPHTGSLAMRQLVRLGGQFIEGETIPVRESSPENRRLFVKLYSGFLYDSLARQTRELSRHRRGRIPEISRREIEREVKALAGDVISFQELEPSRQEKLSKLASIDHYLDEGFLARVRGQAVPHHDEHRKLWRPRHKRRKYDRRRDWH